MEWLLKHQEGGAGISRAPLVERLLKHQEGGAGFFDSF